MGKKKSRKGGQIGIPKSTIPVVRASSDRVRKSKGNKAGTRNNVETDANSQQQNIKKDPKIGSKKPIDLLRHKRQSGEIAKAPSYATPQLELDAIEQDEKLQLLLDKQDSAKLSKLERAYVDEKLARHLILCELLGISSDLEPQESSDDDPLSALDAISLDDYKD